MKPLEDRVRELMTTPRLYHRGWLDQASAAVVEVGEMRRRCLKMHRRCQAAEAEALREGRRADQMARCLRARGVDESALRC